MRRADINLSENSMRLIEAREPHIKAPGLRPQGEGRLLDSRCARNVQKCGSLINKGLEVFIMEGCS